MHDDPSVLAFYPVGIFNCLPILPSKTTPQVMGAADARKFRPDGSGLLACTQGRENEAAADAAAKVGSSYGETPDMLAYSSPS